MDSGEGWPRLHLPSGSGSAGRSTVTVSLPGAPVPRVNERAAPVMSYGYWPHSGAPVGMPHSGMFPQGPRITHPGMSPRRPHIGSSGMPHPGMPPQRPDIGCSGVTHHGHGIASTGMPPQRPGIVTSQHSGVPLQSGMSPLGYYGPPMSMPYSPEFQLPSSSHSPRPGMLSRGTTSMAPPPGMLRIPQITTYPLSWAPPQETSFVPQMLLPPEQTAAIRSAIPFQSQGTEFSTTPTVLHPSISSAGLNQMAMPQTGTDYFGPGSLMLSGQSFGYARNQHPPQAVPPEGNDVTLGDSVRVCDEVASYLHWAITQDNRHLSAARRGLRLARNRTGDTAIHLAVHCNHLRLLQLLSQLPHTLPESPEVDVCNEFGMSPLHIAVQHSRQQAIHHLLMANASPHKCDNSGDTPLHHACRSGFMWGAEALVNYSNDSLSILNSKTGESTLQLAARHGRTEVVELLVDAGADMNICNINTKWTALYVAAEQGHTELVKLLVDAGADVNMGIYDNSGGTSLHAAAKLGHTEVVKLLVDAGADVNKVNYRDGVTAGGTALHYAAKQGHTGVVKLLVDAGADVNYTMLKKKWLGEWTALHGAAERGHTEVVKLLVDAGADVNKQSTTGATALHTATKQGHTELVKLLINAATDVNMGSCGMIPLLAAAERGDTEVVKFLVNANADVNKQDKTGGTALHAAAERGDTEVVKFLVNAKADVNKQGKNGGTALHAAAERGDTEVVKFLVNADADVNKQDRTGGTALHAGARRGHTEVVNFLVNADADVNKHDTIGRTALHAAAKEGHTEVVKVLVDSVADVNKQDTFGETALYDAAKQGHTEVVKLLVNSGADGVKLNVRDNSSGGTLAHLAAQRDHIKIGVDVNVQNSKTGRTALHEAAGGGHIEALKVLVNAGADVNAQNSKNGMTALHYCKNLRMMKYLIAEVKGDVNSHDSSGSTPLHCASELGDKDMASLLVAHGADVNILNNEGKSPLDVAAVAQHGAIVHLLEEAMEGHEAGSTQMGPAPEGDIVEESDFSAAHEEGEETSEETSEPEISGTVLEMRKQHKKLYEKAIKGKITVDIRAVRFNNIGLPRSGKTSFRRRLMGEIRNILITMSQGGKVEPSTAIAETTIQIIRTMCIQMGVITSTKQLTKEWTVIKDFKEEIRMLNQLIHRITLGAPTRDETATEKVSVPHNSLDNSAEVPDIDIPVSEATPTTTEAQSVPHLSHEVPNDPEDEDIEEMFSFMNKAMEESDWIKVKCLLEDLILIINTDTGGQAEFLDLHASLVSGPSFNLLFSRLVDNMDKMFKVYYTNEEGISTKKEDSTLTVEEVMYQALASIACFSGSFLDENKSPVANTHDKFLSKSKVMFVGTHRDLINAKQFKKKDNFLKRRIKDTEFYKRDMVEFASEDQVMLAVNNYDGGEGEIESIRHRLEIAITKNFGKIQIPVAWLVLSFCLRYTKMRTMSLKMCEGIARKLNIGPDELQEALWFLHHCVGLLLYYPELEALKDTVICDIQVVFDSASNLIKNTFTFNKVGPRVAENFSEKALFSQSDLERAAFNQTDNLLPLQNVVSLLEHLSILTPSQPADSMQGPSYFMPCVLKSARAEDLAVIRSDSDPAPLMLRYECGYVPVGVFPAMITNLVSQQRNIGWEIVEEGLRKNRVQFTVGKDFDTVTLISHPRFFEVVVTRNEDFEISTESLCSEVLNVVESTLNSVTSRMNYNFSMGYKFGFECPVHSATNHLCIVVDKTARRMRCLHNPKQTPRLENCHSVWFALQNGTVSCESTPPVGVHRGSNVGNEPAHDRVSGTSGHDPITEDEITRANKILKRYSHKWREIGEALGFKASELDNIMGRPKLFHSAPSSYLSAMLSEWQEWAPGDHRGSKTYATLHSLRKAVDRAGLGLTAQELV